ARNTYAAYVPLPPVAARSQLSDSVALSARTARATGPPAPSLPETPLVVSFLCTAQNHSSSPESFVVCLSISSGGNLLYIPVERETLFRVSLERKPSAANASNRVFPRPAGGILILYGLLLQFAA